MVLLVEDNADDEMLAMRALKGADASLEVCVAHDGEEAIEMLTGDSRVDAPTLVLLDLKLPKRSGFEVLQRIREDALLAHVPVVVLTSSDEPVDLTEAYRLGANSYLQKDMDFDAYLTAVRAAGEYWTRYNRPAPPEPTGV